MAPNIELEYASLYRRKILIAFLIPYRLLNVMETFPYTVIEGQMNYYECISLFGMARWIIDVLLWLHFLIRYTIVESNDCYGCMSL